MTGKYVFDNPHAYRGFFISKFAELETSINTYLALHFDPAPNGNELWNTLIDRITFEGKRTAYKHLLEKECIKEGFVKTKNNKWPYSELLDGIRKINETRIYFAHYVLSGEGFTINETVIELIEFRNGDSLIEYTQEAYDDIIDLLEEIDAAIGKTYKYLKVVYKST